MRRAILEGMLQEFARAGLECKSLAEYDAAIAEGLTRTIGCDTFYLGAALPVRRRRPVVAGVGDAYVSRCEATAARYWPDRFALHEAALARGGAAQDLDVFGARERDARPFYRDVVRGLGIRAIAACVLTFRDEPIAAIYLGRTSRGASFARQLDTLRHALPTLSLGYAAQLARPRPPRLTEREREVLAHAGRGLTNAEIGIALGTSANTVKKQIASLLEKCEVANRTELVARFGTHHD